MRDNDIEIVKSDIRNPHQLKAAVDLVYHQIVLGGFAGKFGFFMHQLRSVPCSYRYREVDRRWKEMKAVEAAGDKLQQAVHEYDQAIAMLELRLGIN
jgi:hypothetical protein